MFRCLWLVSSCPFRAISFCIFFFFCSFSFFGFVFSALHFFFVFSGITFVYFFCCFQFRPFWLSSDFIQAVMIYCAVAPGIYLSVISFLLFPSLSVLMRFSLICELSAGSSSWGAATLFSIFRLDSSDYGRCCCFFILAAPCTASSSPRVQ